MKQKLLLLVATVLLSSANVFASDRFTWGYWALERGSFDDAVYHFKIGADAGYWDCKKGLAHMYILGLGTAKNPGKALSLLKEVYPQESEEESDNRFWFLFYMGANLADYDSGDINKNMGYEYLPNHFYYIPKIFDAYEKGIFTCNSFGVSPNTPQAVKYLKKLKNTKKLLDCHPTSYKIEEYVFNRLFAYSKTTKDDTLNRILHAANKTARDYYYAQNLVEDSINYAKTTKTIEPLKTFIKNAKTEEWKEKAKVTCETLIYTDLFVKLDNNEPLLAESIIQDKSISDFLFAEKVIKISRQYNNIKKKIEANSPAQREILATLEQIEECEKNYADTQNKLEKCGVPRSKTFLTEMRAELVTAYESQQLEASKKWDATTEISSMNELISSVNDNYKAQMKETYQEVLLNKAAAWNTTTKIAEMDDVVNARYCNKENKEKLVSTYQKVALDKAAAWEVNTEIAEMDAVIEAKYINEETKGKLLAAYQENALARMGTIKKSRDTNTIGNTANAVISMKHLDNVTRNKTLRAREKAMNRTIPFFHIGVEGMGGFTGKVSASDLGIGGGIMLGKPCHWFNIYAGGFYTWYSGTLGDTMGEDARLEAPWFDENFGFKFQKIEFPVELRYNYVRSRSISAYVGLGGSYNMMKGGTLNRYRRASDYDVYDINESIKLTDGLNDEYLAARISLGLFAAGFDMSLYVKYNLSSPFNPEGQTDKLGEYPGYAAKQLGSKFTTGLKMGFFF